MHNFASRQVSTTNLTHFGCPASIFNLELKREQDPSGTVFDCSVSGLSVQLQSNGAGKFFIWVLPVSHVKWDVTKAWVKAAFRALE